MRRRATREELREGARQIAHACVRMQLQAQEALIENSLAELHEPEGLPQVEPLPDPCPGWLRASC